MKQNKKSIQIESVLISESNTCCFTNTRVSDITTGKSHNFTSTTLLSKIWVLGDAKLCHWESSSWCSKGSCCLQPQDQGHYNHLKCHELLTQQHGITFHKTRSPVILLWASQIWHYVTLPQSCYSVWCTANKFMHSGKSGVSNSTVRTIRTFLVIVVSVKDRTITWITVRVFTDNVRRTGVLLVLHAARQRDAKPHWTCATNSKATINTFLYIHWPTQRHNSFVNAYKLGNFPICFKCKCLLEAQMCQCMHKTFVSTLQWKYHIYL